PSARRRADRRASARRAWASKQESRMLVATRLLLLKSGSGVNAAAKARAGWVRRSPVFDSKRRLLRPVSVCRRLLRCQLPGPALGRGVSAQIQQAACGLIRLVYWHPLMGVTLIIHRLKPH